MSSTCLDLFAGCGGLSLGLHSAGFRPVAALEAHPDAFATYKHNLLDTGLAGAGWPDWLPVGSHDVVSVVSEHRAGLRELRGTIDLVAGGPPCQGFSTNGRRNPDDPRSKMVEAYLDIVELVRPRLVLLENVRGFVSMPHASGRTYAEAVKDHLRRLGYDVWASVLVASDWGVPQRRPRYFCVAAPIGSLPGIDPIERLRISRREFLSRRHLWPTPTTARQALSDLVWHGDAAVADGDWGHQGFKAVERANGEGLTAFQKLMRVGCEGQPSDRRVARHSARTIARMRFILDSCTRGASVRPSDRARLGIGKRTTTPLDADAPSSTVTTLPDDLIHYSDARTMSVRELARLQSFPDWFSFQGPYTSGGPGRQDACPRYTQVGNAVPPLLAEALGEMLLGLLADQKFPKQTDVAQPREELSPVALEIVNGQRGGTPATDDAPSGVGPLLESMCECVAPVEDVVRVGLKLA